MPLQDANPTPSFGGFGFSHMAHMIEAATLLERAQQGKAGPVSISHPSRWAERAGPIEEAGGAVAHDLNNILTTILSHAQALENEAGRSGAGTAAPPSGSTDRGEVVLRHSSAIRQAALDGAEAVRAMRALTGRSTGRPAYPVALNDIVTSTLGMLEPRWKLGRISPSSAIGGRRAREPTKGGRVEGAPRQPVRLVVNLGPAGYIAGSPAELRRALTNIVSNAVDSLPAEQGRIEITSGREGPWSFIRVRDNGAGMSAGTRGRI